MRELRKTLAALAILTIVVGSYALLTNKAKEMMIYLQLIVITFTIVSGFSQIKENRKGYGILMFFVAGFLIVLIVLGNLL